MDIFLITTVTLTILIDPIGNLPIFNHIMSKVPAKSRTAVLVQEFLIAYAVLLSFLFWGERILNAIGIQQSALQIISGTILFLIGIEMFFSSSGKRTATLTQERPRRPLIVPIAIPLVAGPATMTELMLFSSQYPDKHIILLAALTCAWLFSAILLGNAIRIFQFIGMRMTAIIEKLIAIVLIMLSIQFFLDGLKQ